MEKKYRNGNARTQGAPQSGDFSRLVKPKASWKDLRLNPAVLSKLKNFCNHAKQIEQMSRKHTSDRRLLHRKGLTAFFYGPPGSGKTLAAEVIACELETSLYKVDLASVVNKYIGETEKNLRKIFDAANIYNLVLLFDEADALFGNRTEVSDSHDRYANLEIEYFLKRVEGYEGVIILSTSLRKNIDEAFTRRIRAIIEFPLPNSQSRQSPWGDNSSKD